MVRCFLGEVGRNLIVLGKSYKKKKKTFCIYGITFLIQGVKENLCLYRVPTPESLPPVTFKGQLLQVWLGLACVEFQPASPQHTGEFGIFLPPSFLLFLFSVNSSCSRNIDKYSRECFSGRRMLPEHF